MFWFIADIHQVEIDEWKKVDEKFVETNAVDMMLLHLKQHSHLTVTGKPGIGKSAAIHHVALLLNKNNGYDVIPCENPSDVFSHYRMNTYQIFVMDDVCGRYIANQNDIEEWLKQKQRIIKILNKGKSKLVTSCRLQVFRECQFQRIDLFSKSFCDLSSENFTPSDNEKVQIASKYLDESTIECFKSNLDQFEFSPLLCSLFQQNSERTIINFFQKPFDIYEEELNNLYEQDKKTKFCALFLCVLYNGKLDKLLLQKEDRRKFEHVLEACCINIGTPVQCIMEQLHSLTSTYLRSIDNLYIVNHDALFDFLCFYYGKQLQNTIIMFADSKIIRERTQFRSLSRDSNELTIMIEAENETCYFERIIEDLKNGRIVDVFYNNQMKFDKYRSKLIRHFKQHDQTHLKILLNPTDIEDTFSRIPICVACYIGYLDIVEYFIEITDKIDGYEYPPLLIACEGGHEDIVKLLISKGASVNKANDIMGWTPLIAACAGGHKRIVEILMGAGAAVNKADQQGSTPLMWACDEGHKEAACTLLKYTSIIDKASTTNTPVNIDQRDEPGNTALLRACLGKDASIVKFLIDRGANVNTANHNSGSTTPLKQACTTGNKKIVQMLLSSGASLEEGGYNSPLTIASTHGHTDVVHLLIDNGAPLNDSGPLLAAYENEDIDMVRFLLKKGSKTNSDVCGKDALMTACSLGNENLVSLLISYGARINGNGHSAPILWTCQGEHKNILHTLVKHGADINKADHENITALMVSCYHGHYDIVEFLLERKSDVNSKDKKGRTPLLWACKGNHFKIVLSLIEKGAETNMTDRDGWSPLMEACKNASKMIIELLMEKGADTNHVLLKDTNAYGRFENFYCSCLTDIRRLMVVSGSKLKGRTPLILAVECNYPEIVTLVIDKGGDVNKSDIIGWTPLMQACQDKNEKLCDVLLQRGAYIDSFDANGQNALLVACAVDDKSLISLLLQKGASVNIKHKITSTPFIWACKNGRTEVVQQMLNYGADVDMTDHNGFSPLMFACAKGNTTICEILIENQCQVNTCNNVGDSPLTLAFLGEYESLIKCLVANGFDINMTNTTGDSPLMHACLMRNKNVVDILLSKGADVNHRNNKGESVLVKALKGGCKAIVDVLLTLLTDITETDMETTLIWACRRRDETTVRLLVGKGVNVNISGLIGVTPLRLACDTNGISIIKILIENGASVNTCDNFGWTPLMRACLNGNEQTSKILVEHGADINATNCNGQTPLFLSCRENHSKTINFLLDIGVDINQPDNKGNTPLMLAMTKRS